ncbi:hypothetical protein BDQ12DRAFT_690147 [Crucibulum laeve]|uniref:Uncharacterized protein n=1 Tax=Crucibulum laeve TaxID=68775 RepID=A0A5C3LP94_9AGAR|nr:hypothetical protein BDQ12DRAFT_690147 [Crucibulum laeve]
MDVLALMLWASGPRVAVGGQRRCALAGIIYVNPIRVLSDTNSCSHPYLHRTSPLSPPLRVFTSGVGLAAHLMMLVL